MPDVVTVSLLDRSRTRDGFADGEALRHSVERAQDAERLGYHRFWVAEHHAVPGIASGAPAVLLAAIGAATSTIRLGSGGVMLPNHQPLVVAEQFLMLAALHPGRIDLGLGRSLGFTAPVRRALRHDADAPDTFADDVRELASYLDRTAAVTARPAAEAPIPLFLLATGRGLAIAAALGLPVVIGGPILAEPGLDDVLRSYRAGFAGDGVPRVVLAADVLVADTEEEARDLALPEAWATARSRQTGSFAPLEPIHRIKDELAAAVPPRVAEQVAAAQARTITGTPASVASRIAQLVERTGADELLASGATYDRDALRASDAALAALFDAAT